MAERMIQVNGVELCTESLGDPADRPILLVQGVGASMLWWDEGVCLTLSGAGRFVIRYDHCDTGRSRTYEPGRPGYIGADLLADAAGVLDAYGIASPHVVGVSAGGAFAQLLALKSPNRVRSLVLISNSAATPGDRELPPPPIGSGGSSPPPRPTRRTRTRARGEHRICGAVDDERGHGDRGQRRALGLALRSSSTCSATAECSRETSARSMAAHGIDPADRETIAAAIIDHTLAADPAR